MSVSEPTAVQAEKVAHIHRAQLGQIPGDRKSIGLYCLECKQEYPCRTMKALGVKK